jgi:hypothetical protein
MLLRRKWEFSWKIFFNRKNWKTIHSYSQRILQYQIPSIYSWDRSKWRQLGWRKVQNPGNPQHKLQLHRPILQSHFQSLMGGSEKIFLNFEKNWLKFSGLTILVPQEITCFFLSNSVINPPSSTIPVSPVLNQPSLSKLSLFAWSFLKYRWKILK